MWNIILVLVILVIIVSIIALLFYIKPKGGLIPSLPKSFPKSNHFLYPMWVIVGLVVLGLIFFITKTAWTKSLLSNSTTWLIMLLTVASSTLWPVSKKFGWITAIIVIGGSLFAINANRRSIGWIPSGVTTTKGGSAYVAELPESFGWKRITIPEWEDGEPVLTDKISVRNLEKPELVGYILAYRPVSPDDVDDFMVIPDGKIKKMFPFGGNKNYTADHHIQFVSKTGKSVDMAVGYIRKDLPQGTFPKEESEFLAKLAEE